jgi:hypothetical protein
MVRISDRGLFILEALDGDRGQHQVPGRADVELLCLRKFAHSAAHLATLTLLLFLFRVESDAVRLTNS